MSVVVFDIGKVVIEWDPRHLYRRLFEGDEARVEWFLSTVCTPAWNHRQDLGRPFAEGVAELSVRFPEHADLIAAYDRQWEEMVPGAIDGTVEVIRTLKHRGTRLYALTNFSVEKFALVRARFDVFGLFDGVVVSGDVGHAKPDLAIYRCLLGRFDLDPRNCVFVDDNPCNVTAARTLGMDGIRFTDADDLQRRLAERGVL